MKLQVLQENLSKVLSIASRFTNNKAQLPVLANILMIAKKNRLILSSTNLENSVSLSIGAKIQKQGEITISAKVFTDIIANLPLGAVNLQTDHEKLKVSTSNFNSVVAGMNSADFPAIPQVVGSQALKLPQNNFLQALSCVLFAASVDETRPVLTGVLFIFKNNKLYLVATDGFRLSQQELKIAYQGKELKIILPKNVLAELGRLSDDQDLIKFDYKKRESQVVFGIDSTVLASRTIEGEFPDFNKIIPKDSKIIINLDCEELLRAVKLASVFARDSANVVKMVVKKDFIELNAESSQSGSQETKIDAKLTGMTKKSGELTIAFNYRFLEDFLNAVKSEEVQIELIDANSPGVFTDPKNKNFLHLIMPVRLHGD